MKLKLLRDILVYIVVPILFFNVSISNMQIVFQISCSIAIAYSIFTKIKENRINVTGLVLFFIIILLFISNKNSDLDNVYFYNTCILLSLALINPILNIFNKDISIIIIKDMLRSLNRNSVAIIRLLKKKAMFNEISRIYSLVETNLILVSLLRIINILVYNAQVNSYLNFMTNCIGIIFFTITIYKIVKITNAYKKLNIDKNNINLSPEDDTKGKIINFSSFNK